MKYGTVDLNLLELLKPWFGDQAEVVRLKPLTFDGGTARAVVKTTDDLMPDGGDRASDELPHYKVEFTQAVTIKFVKG